MEKPKTITIVIPTKNNQDTISELLISLMNQSVKPDEIIVVDSSTDRTPAIVLGFPVKLIRTPANGANSARNTGVKNSAGDIVAFIDGDCKADMDWIKYITQGFDNENIACVGGSVKTLNLDTFFGLYGKLSWIPLMPEYKNNYTINDTNFLKRKPVSANMAVAKEIFVKIGYFDENYKGGYEEFDYEYRVVKSGYDILCTGEAIVEHKHRETFSSLVNQYYLYGLGSGRFCRKYPHASFTKWHKRNELILFSILILYIYSLIFISNNIIFWLFVLLSTPILYLIIYYFKLFFKKESFYIPAYVFIDIMRIYSFYIGQLIGRSKKL